MRVAVYLPKGHPEAGVDPESGQPVEEPREFAYRLGRIEEGVHNAPIGHPEIPFEEFVNGLAEQARQEYPDARVVIEKMIDNGDRTAAWIAAEEFDPEKHTPMGAGNIKATEIHVTNEQDAPQGS